MHENARKCTKFSCNMCACQSLSAAVRDMLGHSELAERKHCVVSARMVLLVVTDVCSCLMPVWPRDRG